MSELTLLPHADDSGISPFDRIRQLRPDGSEFWSARSLQALMAYAAWRNFQPAIERAIQTASNTGMDVTSHFAGSRKNSGGRPADDYELSRQAAYLVAMNGDPNKPEVAAAQAYFAVQTERMEMIERTPATDLPAWAVSLHALVDQGVRVEMEQRRQAAELATVQAKVAGIEGEHNWFTALAYAKLHDLNTSRPYLSRVGACAARVMRERGEEPHRRQDASFGQINVYPIWALEIAFERIPTTR